MKLALCMLFALFAAAAAAQSYPAKPIRLIVPNAPGGGTDTIARAIAEKLSPALGQTIVVDNRGGAGGRIAAELVARSPKDGYTLLLGSAATLITGPALDGDRKYDPLKDFAHVSLAGRTAYMLVVHPSLPAKNVRDFIAIARAQPRRISYSTTGQGTGDGAALRDRRRLAAARARRRRSRHVFACADGVALRGAVREMEPRDSAGRREERLSRRRGRT